MAYLSGVHKNFIRIHKPKNRFIQQHQTLMTISDLPSSGSASGKPENSLERLNWMRRISEEEAKAGEGEALWVNPLYLAYWSGTDEYIPK